MDDTLLHLDDGDEIDITQQLIKALNEHSKSSIFFKDSSVDIELHRISIEDGSLIKHIINLWQKSLTENGQLDSSLINQVSEGDKLFLQGMYNYYLGCTAIHYKASRYDDAFAILSQFHELNGIGRCVLKSIAFRRNWVDSLCVLTVGQSDIFATASEYFMGLPSDFSYENDYSAESLFVEEGTNNSLSLISLFQKGRFAEVTEKLDSLGDIEDIEDKNLAEQLNLLRARLYAIEGKRSLAIQYYEKLITPAFRNEFQEFKSLH